MQGQRQGQNQDQDQESKVRVRIRVKSLRSVASTGARGQESKFRVQESKVRTISRARV